MEKEKDTITIGIKMTTWSTLNARKQPGESFDNLINRLCLEEPPIKSKPRSKKK